MREILFRGKCLDEGQWVMGTPWQSVNGNGRVYMRCTIEIEGRPVIVDAAVDPSTIGQYTGLTDMQDVKIFEGDIVQFGGEYGKIEYSETEAMFQAVFDGWLTDFDHLRGTDVEIEDNIHDNPELLEG